ncbi:MAG: hypothetical protein ACI8PZ_005152 [Myxococcota bacterium]|jgi:hypothetical protein
MLRALPALLLLVACPGENPDNTGKSDELDCPAMCIYLCAQAPAESGMNVAACNETCTTEAVGITDCGECWAVSGSSPAWDEAELLVDCVCWDAPDTVGCDDVEVDEAACGSTCARFTGLFD